MCWKKKSVTKQWLLRKSNAHLWYACLNKKRRGAPSGSSVSLMYIGLHIEGSVEALGKHFLSKITAFYILFIL